MAGGAGGTGWAVAVGGVVLVLFAALLGLVQQLRSVPDLPPVRAVSVSSAPEAPARSHGDRCEGLWCGYGELRACCASTAYCCRDGDTLRYYCATSSACAR